MNKFTQIPAKLPAVAHGETDPVVIRAAYALAQVRCARMAHAHDDDDWGGLSVSAIDIEDARAVLATLGMLRI
jgi:hypothetical protein